MKKTYRKKGYPPRRVKVSEALYEKKVDPFALNQGGPCP